jgi:hypothetical protein
MGMNSNSGQVNYQSVIRLLVCLLAGAAIIGAYCKGRQDVLVGHYKKRFPRSSRKPHPADAKLQ